MSYVSKQVTVLVCDICLKQTSDDLPIMKVFQPTEESLVLDICTDCWSKIRALVHEEDGD